MCQGLERLAKGSFGGEDWGPVVGGGFGNERLGEENSCEGKSQHFLSQCPPYCGFADWS